MLEAFRAERHRLRISWSAGSDSGAILASHTAIVDEYIVGSFKTAQLGVCMEGICLVALGGYGRQEMFPGSDIDLMILYRPEVKDCIAQVADAVLYPLWDTGLDVGHGVRTVEESMVHADEEYFFLVALLDARFLYGDRQLFEELLSEFNRRFVDGHREIFVDRMKMFRESRRVKFGSHSYLLEPHLKEGRGGMRDIQAMMWTAKVVFGLKNLDDFQDAGLLLENEKKMFLRAREFLVRLRCYMHYLNDRKSDQLFYEQQSEVAQGFGYRENDGVSGVEHFIGDLYDALHTVTLTTDLFFDHVDEVLGICDKGLRVSDRQVEKGIEVKGGKIHLTATGKQMAAKPQIIVRLFLVMARTGLPLHHRTRKSLPEVVGLIDDKQRCSPRLAKTFFALLSGAKDIYAVLSMMLETGVLQAVIPEFGRIATLAQYDLYHIYTVDRHSLQAVAELYSLADSESWGNVMASVKDLNVLYLAALLHDIGKGVGRDHSVEGARLAKGAGERLGFDEAQCDAIEFLVRYHLFIPENALRRDLNDAVFIKRCAELIGDLDRLSMLYLLSVADSRATGPSAWSEWKAALMEELFLKVTPYLDFGHHGVHDVLAHEEQGVEWLRDQVRVHLLAEKELRVDPERLSTDYILSFSPETIAEHVVIQRDNFNRIRQKALVRAAEVDDGWQLLVMTVDRPGLLAKICGVMTLNNLTVAKAQIFTWYDSTVVDVLNVQPTDGLGFAEKDWQSINEQLDRAVEHRMGLSHRLYSKLASGYGGAPRPGGQVSTKVVIDNNSSENYSVIEVYAPDRPAQLYYITQSLADFGINIHKAYIATEVEQLIDAFYVLDTNGRKLLDEELKEEITQGVLYAITHSV
ncbi:[protein-PII] uridylyltransferase [Desulforhopalus singaporensis]|uniref:Bifunctional uridylyltransferase/uridylyl-removing enzyme n=1 Tax=Desulforhopalus singaporensis TaxID=91360 RepID=A0A1H0JLX5_9BACT|nr:[protein-PII] uridylyltransferase [Desulforhopalus singaporensis]SDO44493.1 UTP--GlnB (protein PII) uridylyltransferase, GlnD [Desulforhopalus singaporensis]